MKGIKFQCKITSLELQNERLQRESDLTFRMDILYVIPTSKRHFHSCSNETFDIQVQFEVQVSIILCHTIQNMIKQEGDFYSSRVSTLGINISGLLRIKYPKNLHYV